MKVYLDNSATTLAYEEVMDELLLTMKNYFGNPSSAHSLGVAAEKKLTEAREIIAKSINASKEEIIFTSCGSESNNFLIKGFARKGTRVITTAIEHPSVINACVDLEAEGVEVIYLDVNENGQISLIDLENAIDKNTVLVSIMHVNNEVGTIQDIKSIGKLIKEKSSRARFHVDAVQSFGKMKLDVKECNIDLLSASGHKIHGPRGIGFAYIRKGLTPKPLISGGGQERNLRSGTENTPAIVGLAKAVEIMDAKLKSNLTSASELKDYFLSKIQSMDKICINSQGDGFSPYILSVSFDGVKGEVLLHSLEAKGIYVSTGSACSAKKDSDSYVLKALGLDKKFIEGTIRFSFDSENTKEEIDYTFEVLESSIKFLRSLRR